MPKQKSILNKLALAISAIFSPFIILPAVLTVFAWRLTDNLNDFYLFLTIAFIFMLLVPGLYIMIQVKRKVIDDLHIYKLEQRMGAFSVFLTGSFITTLLYFYLDAPLKLTGFIILAFLGALISGIITLKWKISIHMVAFSTTAVAYALLLQTQMAWATLGFIPFIIWSRVYRKRHTLAQTIAGTILGATLSVIFYGVFLQIQG